MRVVDQADQRLIFGHFGQPLLTHALDAVRTLDVGTADVGRLLWLAGNRAGGIIAAEVWDDGAGRTLASRQVQLARDAGPLVQLQFALNFLANNELFAGNVAAAEALIDEDRLVADITGNPPVAYTAMLLACFQGRETLAAELIAATADEALMRGQGPRTVEWHMRKVFTKLGISSRRQLRGAPLAALSQ